MNEYLTCPHCGERHEIHNPCRNRCGFPGRPPSRSPEAEAKARYTVEEIRHVRANTPDTDAWEAAAIDSLLMALAAERERAIADCEKLAEQHRKQFSGGGGCDAGLSAARREGKREMARELRDAIRALKGKP